MNGREMKAQYLVYVQDAIIRGEMDGENMSVHGAYQLKV
jgi:hypothetical protein